MHDKNSNKFYRKVPKVTTLVTFGFSTLYYTAITTFGGSLLSGSRYFGMAKRRTVDSL